MKKLALDLEDLVVESFATDAAPRDTGTVHGHARSNNMCNSDWSCHDTCYFLSCYDSDCGKCLDTYDMATCDIYCGTGGTSCNQPCMDTCGEYSCDPQNTCLHTCAGYPDTTCG